MADLKISQLTDGGNSQATDEYVVARSGSNYRIDGASVAAAATSVGTLTSLTVSGDLTVDTSTLKVDSANNRVGIGTASPATTLEVSGGSKFSTGANTAVIIDTNSDSTTYNLISLNGSRTNAGHIGFMGGATGNSSLYIDVPTGGSINFRSNVANTAMIDASGNLGLGVTPSAWGGGFIGFQLSNSISLWGKSGSAAYYSNNVYYDGTNRKYITSNAATEYEQGSGSHSWKYAASGTAGNNISFTAAMTLDASGNLGVGTTSVTSGSRLTVSGGNLDVINGNATAMLIRNATTNVMGLGLQSWAAGGGSSSAGAIYVYGANPLTFYTNDTERARITEVGEFLVGTTSTSIVSASSGSGGLNYLPGDYLVVATNGGASLYLNRIGTDGGAQAFRKDGATVGSISVTASATAYNTSSDVRLKENIEPAEDAGDIIDAINIVKYDWKSGGHVRYGLIAQSEYETVPEAISVGDADDVETLENPWGVDYSKLVPMLVKEIQSLRLRVAALEA